MAQCSQTLYVFKLFSVGMIHVYIFLVVFVNQLYDIVPNLFDHL